MDYEAEARKTAVKLNEKIASVSDGTFADSTIGFSKLSEISKRCKDRMDLSYYKYGAARDNFASGRVDAIGCVDLCLDKFRKTKNNEYLYDVINYVAYRIMFPMPDEYYKPTDSSESAGTDGTPINFEKE